eukprot:Rhum_TRINITY_DN14559_c21_g1::Rhum_TRINITY_DN14559_c21_g1_i1::g.98685::m.98685
MQMHTSPVHAMLSGCIQSCTLTHTSLPPPHFHSHLTRTNTHAHTFARDIQLQDPTNTNSFFFPPSLFFHARTQLFNQIPPLLYIACFFLYSLPCPKKNKRKKKKNHTFVFSFLFFIPFPFFPLFYLVCTHPPPPPHRHQIAPHPLRQPHFTHPQPSLHPPPPPTKKNFAIFFRAAIYLLLYLRPPPPTHTQAFPHLIHLLTFFLYYFFLRRASIFFFLAKIKKKATTKKTNNLPPRACSTSTGRARSARAFATPSPLSPLPPPLLEGGKKEDEDAGREGKGNTYFSAHNKTTERIHPVTRFLIPTKTLHTHTPPHTPSMCA